MTAISKSWVSIADTAVDPDSPIDTALMTGIRDGLVHLREWLGASYTAGAVQDHNHDGSNSALVEIGPNAIRNGSFENGTSGWTLSNFTGGSLATNTANHMDGATALAITSTVLANGGGELFSNEYRTIAEGRLVHVEWQTKASVANVSSKAEVYWYNSAKSQISVSTLYSTTNTPTSLTRLTLEAVAPSNARFYRIKFTGGIPSSGTAVGTVYIDGVVATTGEAAEAGNYVICQAAGALGGSTLVKVAESVVGRSGTYRVLATGSGDSGASIQVYKNGIAYSGLTTGSINQDLQFNRGDLLQLYGAADSGGTFTLKVAEKQPASTTAAS